MSRNAKKVNGRQFVAAFTEGYKTARLLETLENFSVADHLDVRDDEQDHTINPYTVGSDEAFWHDVLNSDDHLIGRQVNIDHCILSAWVPRVPGLYCSKNSDSIRKFADGHIEAVGKSWMHFAPIGKSAMVMGGIGTIMLPADIQGNRMGSITIESDTSLGIPVVIPAEIWSDLHPNEGVEMSLKKVRWEFMNQQWISRFPSIKGIPRACLSIRSIDQVKVTRSSSRTYLIHPFSVMEYTSNDATFYDYVYATAQMRMGNCDRNSLGNFFESYRTAKGRNGNYLLAADIQDPFFDSTYTTPEDLRRYETSGKSHLNILERKIRNEYFKGKLLEEIMLALASVYQDEDSIYRIAAFAGVSKAKLRNDSPSSMISQLVDICIHEEKLETLIDKASIEYPQLIE